MSSSPLSSEVSFDEKPTSARKSRSPSEKLSEDDERNPQREQRDSEESDAPVRPTRQKKLEDMFSDEDDDEDEPSNKPARKRAPVDDDDDDDDEPMRSPARSARSRSGGRGDKGDDEEMQGDDLFGDDSEEEKPARKARLIDEESLDSRDDMDADTARLRGTYDEEERDEEKQEVSYEVDIGLHPLPKSTDDEVFLLKIPQFISISPSVFIPDEFTPPVQTDPAISSFNQATNAIRWRRSQDNPGQMESNSRIIQWSDGTFSLQIGSSKEQLYDLPSNALLPPKNYNYHSSEDSFTFLAEPLAGSGLIRCFNHATRTMAVVPAQDKGISEDVKNLLAARYGMESKRSNYRERDRTLEISFKMEDPERARNEALQAEKLKDKYERTRRNKKERLENGAMMDNRRKQDRSRYNFNRSPGVEEEEEDQPSRAARANGKRRGGRPTEGGRHRNEDEYDMDDGFLEADPESDEEVESDMSEESNAGRKKSKSKSKSKSSKRRAEREAASEEEEEEEEAEFTDDEEERPRKSAAPKAASDDDMSDDAPVSSKHERKRRKVAVVDSEEE